MTNVTLQVGRLYPCNEEAVKSALRGLGIDSVTDSRDGIVSFPYDAERHYFTEILEAIEREGCAVLRFVSARGARTSY